MLEITDIIEYLTPHVSLELNKKLYQNSDWGALCKSDRGRKISYLEKLE